jgi:hypothetical protein
MSLEGYVHDLEKACRELAALPRRCAWRGYSGLEESCGADAIRFGYGYANDAFPESGGSYVYLCRKHATLEQATMEAAEAASNPCDDLHWEYLLDRAREAEGAEDVVALIEREVHVAELLSKARAAYIGRLEALSAPATVEELDLAYMETIEKAREEIPPSL